MCKCLLLCILFATITTVINADPELLKCLVCKTSLDELDVVVKKLDPTIKTDLGGYRLDSEGNVKRQAVSQAKSELVLSDLIDGVCTTLDDYVRVVWKNNGSLTIMKMIIDGQMNADFGSVNFVQDEDLNRSLKFYCEGILEEYEEDIIKDYANEVEDIKTSICTNKARLCRDEGVEKIVDDDDDDDEEDEEKEEEQSKDEL